MILGCVPGTKHGGRLNVYVALRALLPALADMVEAAGSAERDCRIDHEGYRNILDPTATRIIEASRRLAAAVGEMQR